MKRKTNWEAVGALATVAGSIITLLALLCGSGVLLQSGTSEGAEKSNIVIIFQQRATPINSTAKYTSFETYRGTSYNGAMYAGSYTETKPDGTIYTCYRYYTP